MISVFVLPVVKNAGVVLYWWVHKKQSVSWYPCIEYTVEDAVCAEGGTADNAHLVAVIHQAWSSWIHRRVEEALHSESICLGCECDGTLCHVHAELWECLFVCEVRIVCGGREEEE